MGPNDNGNNEDEGDDPKPSIEQAFEWIRAGNEAAKKPTEQWEASNYYSCASNLLTQLAEEQQSALPVTPENLKIGALYQTQSTDYFEKARQCLISALQHLGATSKATTNTEGRENEVLEDDEAMSRLELFAQLFSKPALLSSGQQNQESASDTDDQGGVDELAQRLQALNDSIPSGGFPPIDAKPGDKMDDLNAGLKRLGLKPIDSDQTRKTAPLVLDPKKTETEQVDDLIYKMHEQVEVEQGDTPMAMASTDTDVPLDGVVDDDDDECGDMTVDALVSQARDEAKVFQEEIKNSKDEKLSVRLSSTSLVNTKDLLERMLMESEHELSPADITDDEVNSDDSGEREPEVLSDDQRELVLDECAGAQTVLAELIALVELEKQVDRGVVKASVHKAGAMIRRLQRHLNAAVDSTEP